jgi:uncharacterized membrane-anchored protein
MSLNRVSSLETFSFDGPNGENGTVTPEMVRSRRDSDASATLSMRGTRLSFNPLPDNWDPREHRQDAVQAVGAFEVPGWKRILQVIAAVISCFFAAGIVFGFAAIKPVLKDEGAYKSQCASDDPDTEETCVELKLNFMFTAAAVGSNVAALPIGAILDHYGPRACGLLGSVLLAMGAILMAYAIPSSHGMGHELPIDGLLLGYLCLALGGPFTYISAFQLSNAFPRNSGLVMALITGAFDASSAVFLIYRLIYQHTDGAFNLRQFFLAYLAVPAAMTVFQIILMPRQSYKTVTELVVEAHQEPEQQPVTFYEHMEQQEHRSADEYTSLLHGAGVESQDYAPGISADLDSIMGPGKVDAVTCDEVQRHDVSGVWGAMHQEPASRQIASPWFALMCLFTIVQMTRINYFVATINAQYESLLGSEELAARVNGYFDVALPLGGLVAVPFIGLLLDNSSTVGVLLSLVSIATIIGILGIIPNSLLAAYAGILLFVLYRPFYYTAVSDYSAKVFGFKTFGTVYGLIVCLAGVFNFSQSALDHMFHHTFGGDPVPVNVGLLAMGAVIGAALVGYVSRKANQIRAKAEQRRLASGRTQ